MNSTIFFIIVIAILIFTALWYWSKGLMVTILETAALIVAIIAAVILVKPVSGFLNDTIHIDTKISQVILNTISIDHLLNIEQLPDEYKELAPSDADDIQMEDIKELKEKAKKDGISLDFLKINQEEQEKIIDLLPIPNAAKDSLRDNLNRNPLDLDVFAENISLSVARVIVNVISFIFIFIVVMIIWKVVILITDTVSKLPVIKTADSIGGLLLGIAVGVVRIWILFTIITMFASTEWGTQLVGYINENAVLNWINNNNYILKYITRNM